MRAAWLCSFALVLACADDDSSATTTEDDTTTVAATTMPATGMTSSATGSGSGATSAATGATGSATDTSSTGSPATSSTGGGVSCDDCDAGTEFCFHSIIDGPTETSCRPIPTRCAKTPDCACIEPIECPKSAQSCDDAADLVELHCVEG